jgi:type III restriction enzyme
MDYLQLPKVEFYQMKVTYQSIDEEETANTKAKLKSHHQAFGNFKASALISTSEIANIDTGAIDIVNETGIAFANYNQWLFQISRESFGLIKETDLHQYDKELKEIFETFRTRKTATDFSMSCMICI